VRKPRLLDLFCGAGGCTKGYQRAGFYVVGVDVKPQPNYCGDEFVQADALEVLRGEWVPFGGVPGRHWTTSSTLAGFDAIHASPPCQAFTNARVIHGREHADLLTPCRELLGGTGLPWVIENVPGAPMRPDLVLCGSMFPELGDEDHGLIRHRWFEFSDPRILGPLALVQPCQHKDKTVSVFGHGGHIYHGVEQWRRVMGIEWMKRDELAQAIPPAYTELIGHQLMTYLRSSEVAA
jgi:DNA (cytosine-5)-methyltransferase 1